MKKKNILIVVAHPDDEVLGCGGFISKFRKKYNFRIIILGEGSSCRNFRDLKELNKNIKIRQASTKKAAYFLGVKEVLFYDETCGKFRLSPLTDINKIIEKNIEEFRPEIILTHSKHDLNQDHRVVLESVLIAARPNKKNTFLKKIYSFEILSSSEWNYFNQFKPNIFFSLSKKDLNKKIKAFSFFKTEIGKKPYPRSKFGIETLAQFRGLQCNSIYAESYLLIREFN